MTRSAVTIAAEVFGSEMTRARQYVDILLNRGIDYGLLGPAEGERIWDRHILNSAALAPLIPAGSTVADVGSGAGLPGIPLALLRPDVRVTLLEPMLRRSDFLARAVEELELSDRVSVLRVRAEDHDGRYAVVTARAVAPLTRLVEWCHSLGSPAGVLLALKGRSASDEVTTAEPVLRKLGLQARVLSVRAHPESEPATVVRVIRVSRKR